MLIEESVAQATAGDLADSSLDANLDEDLFAAAAMEEPESSILDCWWVALIVGVLGAVGMFLMKMMKRSGGEPDEEGDDEFFEADEEMDEMIPEPEVAIDEE